MNMISCNAMMNINRQRYERIAIFSADSHPINTHTLRTYSYAGRVAFHTINNNL